MKGPKKIDAKTGKKNMDENEKNRTKWKTEGKNKKEIHRKGMKVLAGK